MVCRHSILRQTTRILQLSENSMKFHKTTEQQKTPGWPQGHPTVQSPKYRVITGETIQQEKSMQNSPQT